MHIRAQEQRADDREDALTTASRSRPSSSSWRTCHARVAGKALPEDSMMMRSGAYCSGQRAYPGHISSVSLRVRRTFSHGSSDVHTLDLQEGAPHLSY